MAADVPPASRSRTTSGLPAPLLFVLGGASMYAGAAVAVLLFAAVPPAGVAWLRLLGAAVFLLLWRRPPRTAWRGRRLLLASAFGVVTALMNVAFYEAIARLPLGTAVAVEFIGPVAVAALGSRTPRDRIALVLAAAGVVLIADVRLAGSAAGVALALLAAALWAGYIVLGTRVSRAAAAPGDALDDLTVGFVVAAVVLCPLAVLTAPAAGSPTLLLLGAGVGIASSVVPYALDQVVLRRVGRGRFALLLALLPLTATVVGAVGLAQLPTPTEAAGIAAVVAGVALRSRQAPGPAPRGRGTRGRGTRGRGTRGRDTREGPAG